MAILLNRKYGSRLECLYYILQSCYHKYGRTQQFGLSNLKFDFDDDHNVHSYCKLTTDVLGIQCCPYLVNPLDSSKCYATQSLESDSTKSKAVSDIGGSLEALGFIRKVKPRSYQITLEGEKWAKSDFFSAEWENIARASVLSYGVVIGFLSALRNQSKTFSSSSLYLGYPQTEETVHYRDDFGKIHLVNISAGSEADSVTRTKSRVIGWCVSVGLIEPIGISGNTAYSLAHLKYRDFLNQKELTARTFKKTPLLESLFDTKIYVDNPLAYSRLHKLVRSMRENGGEILRKATMECNDKILNRRFVFTFVLNKFSESNRNVDFDTLVAIMEHYRSYFFTPDNDVFSIMASESQIADLAGIPFEDNNGILTPLTTINEHVLCEDAPTSIIELAKKIATELEEA